MTLISEVIKYKKVSIVGTAKNTGKTECLNYILRNIPSETTLATTSIGVDGETTDAVTHTSKPEVCLKEGMYFATSETHYRERQMVSEIVDLSTTSSSLGRYVTAKVICDGKIKLSGPSSTIELGEWMQKESHYPIDVFLIDGAASRLSSATPFLTDAFVLCTGAAAYRRVDTLIEQTEYLVALSQLEKVKRDELEQSHEISAFVEEKDLFPLKNKYYVVLGALTDRLMNIFLRQKMNGVTLVVTDFTKVFVTLEVYNRFLKKGGRLAVKKTANLIAICINPTSPYGYSMDSSYIRTAISSKVNVPVLDLFVSDEVESIC